MNQPQTPKPTDIKPPFTMETALAKVQAAENAWNTRPGTGLSRLHH